MPKFGLFGAAPGLQSSLVKQYEPETLALVARFTTPPTVARKKQINTLIKSLKTAGVWARLRALYVIAAADAQAAQRNWISDAFNLTPVNSPTFTADRGYVGNGSTSYLNTGFTPSADGGGIFSLNDAHISAFSRTDTAAGVIDMGARTGAAANNTILNLRNPSNFMTGGVNSPTGVALKASASSACLGIVSRSVNGTINASRNGDTYTPVASVADALAAFPIFIGGVNGGGTLQTPTVREYCAATIGGGLTQAQATALYTALNAYKTAVGA